MTRTFEPRRACRPSPAAFAVFDALAVLADGRCVFFGPANAAFAHFEQLGYGHARSRSETVDVAAFVVDVACGTSLPSKPLAEGGTPVVTSGSADEDCDSARVATRKHCDALANAFEASCAGAAAREAVASASAPHHSRRLAGLYTNGEFGPRVVKESGFETRSALALDTIESVRRRAFLESQP